ncbi:MAG: hypothetical protein ACK4HQ_00025 [Brevinematales bacterium]
MEQKNPCWWQPSSSSLPPHHHLLQKKLTFPPLRLLFYQKKSSYIRLQISRDDLFYESYLPWEEWLLLSHKISLFLSSFPPTENICEEAFGLFCEAFRVHLPVLNASWIQLYSHGDLPLWIFPAYKEEALWEFFLPIANPRSLSGNERRLIILDNSLAGAEQETKTILSIAPATLVASDFLFSVIWDTVYTSVHVIAHGKKGSLLLSNQPVSGLPVLVEDLAFFHSCEILFSSQSIAAHTLSQGTRYVIAPATALLDDNSLLDSISSFYQLYNSHNPRYSFHLTSLLFPAFKKSFRLVLPYHRVYSG